MRITDPDRVFDGLLVEQYLSGDRNAIQILIQRWNKRVLAYAFRLTNDRDGAEDISQEVWETAVRKMKNLKEPDKVGSWLLSITHHKCIDSIRTSQKRRTLSAYRSISSSDESLPDDQITRMRRAIKNLKVTHEVVISLFYLEGMSLAEISEILNVSKGTVKSRLFHAREKLKNTLK